MPYVRRFAFLTAGCPENGGARNRRAVARSFLGLVCMTCGVWPPCHKVGSSVYAGGDFTRDASGTRVGGSAFKKGSIPQAVDIPRSSCDHCTLSPSEPPDGVRRCSLEGSASRPSLSATSPSGSAHSWWCRRSCLLPAAVGGVQPHGSWHPSTIIWLQGFSSRSPAAVPRRWSPRRMTTSLVVGRSKPGCGLSPTLSFKDVHQPRCGGRQVEPRPYPPYGLVTPFFLQHSEGKGVHQSCAGADLGYTGPADCRLSTAACLALWGWMALVPPPTLPPAVWSRCGCPSTARATVASCASLPHPWLPLPAGRTGGPYKTSYAAAVAAAFLDGLVLTPVGRYRSENPFVRAEAATAHRCRGGHRRW
jgi:hypothetical protein